ncbi:MAG: hypothetical protein KIT18_07420 [Burkholderiales bacterium]|nr:hypothetical protein [Burkholderiales bacterium]
MLTLLPGVMAMPLSRPAAGQTAPAFTPRITEWQLPKPMFARSSAVAPDGSLYIAVPNDNKVVRFDPRNASFSEWDLLPGHHPNSIVVDRHGTVWTAGFGNGTIGRLKIRRSMIAEFHVPSRGGGPHTLTLSEDGTTLWFSMQTGDRIGGMDIATGRIAEHETSGRPSGITVDHRGHVWWCRASDDRLGHLDPANGSIGELELGHGSRPRRIATAPDGMLWATLYGRGHLARIDPVRMQIVKTYSLPGGNAGAYAVEVDAAGIVWASEIKRDTVTRFDPSTEVMQTIGLPTGNAGIRKLTQDGANRLWYTGSHNGRLGLIEAE